MSWSISLVGKPENIVKALEEESPKLTGQCKLEYDEALPHLVGLVKQNFQNDPASRLLDMELEASGSGWAKGDTQVSRTCTAKIGIFQKRVV